MVDRVAADRYVTARWWLQRAYGDIAVMLCALDAHVGHRVVEIGTGTGYHAALLAHRLGAEQITTIEIDPDMATHARKALSDTGFGTVLIVEASLIFKRLGCLCPRSPVEASPPRPSSAHELSDCVLPLIQGPFDGAAGPGRQPVARPPHLGLLHAFKHGGVGGRGQHVHLNWALRA
jgi:SAM-dependent methyltransferase